MNVPWNRTQELNEEHDLESFRSGRESVDFWLREKARSSAHTVATHVCLTPDDTVVGFFALTTIVVETAGFTSALRRGTQGPMTAILLAQMGLDESEHRRGYGAALFYRAVEEAAVCVAVCRIPLLVVDAADESLVSFYEKLGMRRLPNSLRLAARLDKITQRPT